MSEKDKQSKMEALLKSIKKEYGDVVYSVDDLTNDKDEIISICPSLDIITHGGIPLGSWVSVNGPEKVGKGITTLHFAAKAQKAGMFLVYIDAENRLKGRDACGIAGIDTSPEKFKIFKAGKGSRLYTQEVLNLALKFLTDMEKCLVVIDSLSSLCDANVAKGGVGTETMGKNNHYVAQFCDIGASVVRSNKNIVWGTTQVLANLGYGAKLLEKAAHRWTHQADVRLQAKRRDLIIGDNNKQAIGQKVSWVCHCSAIGPPGGEIDSYIRYGIGIDEHQEILELAESLGFVEKSGSWYTINNKYGEFSKVQGKDAIRDILVSNPEVFDAMRADVKNVVGA